MKQSLFIIIQLVLLQIFLNDSLVGQIKIQEQHEVIELMDWFVKTGKEEPYIEGWRIKIISTTDRRKLESTRWLFRRKYPDLNYSLSHESPYYSLKVGAFESRISLESQLNMFKEDFPMAIPFRDKIMKTELFAD